MSSKAQHEKDSKNAPKLGKFGVLPPPPPSSDAKAQQPDKYKAKFKVIVVGKSGVGKSRFLERVNENNFTEYGPSALSFSEKTLKDLAVSKDKRATINLEIWKPVNRSNNRGIYALSDMQYRGCNGIVAMYDITDADSLEWVKEFLEMDPLRRGDSEIIFVGTKQDLESIREISREEGQAVAGKHRLFEISSKLDTCDEEPNVEKVLESMAQAMFKRHYPELIKEEEHASQNQPAESCCIL